MHYQQVNSTHSKHNEIIYYRNCMFGAHMHRDYELIVLLRGSLELTVERQTVTLQAPMCAVILKDQVHSLRSLRDTSAIIHVFSGDTVPAFSQTVSAKSGATFTFVPPEDALRYYVRNFVLTQDYSPYTIKGLLYIRLGHYLTLTEFSAVLNRQNDLIASIFSYIGSHYRENITLDDVAAFCGYNAHYISRIFASAIGINFRKVLNGYRLAHALELMQDTNLSMTEIALASGFGSVRSFNRVYAESMKSDASSNDPVGKFMAYWESAICLHESSVTGTTITCHDETKLSFIRRDLENYL